MDINRLKDKRVYFVSHSDLDGVGATTLFIYLMRGITKEYILYNESDHELPDFNWDLAKTSDIVIFCDLAPVDLDMYNKIVEHSECFIFDHHITAYDRLGELPDYYFDDNRCGTRILFDELKPARTKLIVQEFVHYVDTMDRWVEESPDFKFARTLSNVMYGYVNWARKNIETDTERYNRFIDMQLIKFSRFKTFELTDSEKVMAKKAKQKEQDNYVLAKKRIKFRIDNAGNKYAYTECSSKISWVCHLLLKEYTELDYIVGFSTFEKDDLNVSIRSSRGFDCQELAETWGGGGHKAAAGLTFKDINDFFAVKEGKKHLT